MNEEDLFHPKLMTLEEFVGMRRGLP